MTSSCHHLNLVIGPSNSPDSELDPLPSPSTRLQPSNVCLGSLFALRHRGERLISPGSPLTKSEGTGRSLVITGRMFGGGDATDVAPLPPAGREVGRPRRVTLDAPDLERGSEAAMRRQFAPSVHRAGVTWGEESLHIGRLKNGESWRRKKTKEKEVGK